ncbi:hypothetical protein F4805DRAFT_436209 [Annulohypoxylon moriforme]|nr:hypothetical protein F4805DRAFT_436209 [Annulohypoxylon moriforme]
MDPPNLDLTLPPFDPGLIHDWRLADYQAASYAIYTLIPGISAERLSEIANIPQEQWDRNQRGNQLVKPGVPHADFSGRPLRDVVAAHVRMDTEFSFNARGERVAGWRPNVLIVVVKEDIEHHGLLLVYGFER